MSAPSFDILQLKSLVTEFYRRQAKDILIGYFFTDKNLDQIIERHTQFVARALGLTQESDLQTQSVHDAHRHLKILPGHFDRRLQILKETLANTPHPPSLGQKWLHLEESQRDFIVQR